MIIPGLYLVETRNLALLEEETKKWEIEYQQRDFITHHSPLPPLESQTTQRVSELKKIQAQRDFNDEFFHRIWSFYEKWGINAHTAYKNLPLKSAQEVIVAVIDTGVDYHHEDLKNVMWVNTNEIPGDGIDNDGNGYIDDIHGINTISRTRFTRRASGDPKAGHWHGTHVAGTIAAEMNNELGITGVAHNVKIMAIRSIPDGANEKDSNIVESLIYAARHGAKVINCSFGKAYTDGPVLKDVIENIGRDYGVLLVVAAGNNSQNIDKRPHYPASFSSANVITVAATNNKGELASFSNLGVKTVDLAAPGTNVFSTVNNNKYTSTSGTSMATPHVSGAAALIWGYYPELTPKEVKDILIKSVKHSKPLEGKIKTSGVLDLAAALKAAAEYRKE